MQLTTERLDLVPLDVERDLADLHTMFMDPIWAAAAYAEPTADLAASNARIVEDYGDNVGLIWALRLHGSSRAIGLIGVYSDQGTSIRGISWYLHRDLWGRGLMGEAARVVVEHLLALPEIDGIEAWIDARNARSIGVARRAQLELAGRLPRRNLGEVSQWMVMARAAEPVAQAVVSIRPQLPVSDVAKTADLLVQLLGLQVIYQFGEPEVEFARLGVSRWNGAPVLDLQRSTEISPVTLGLDIGVPVDSVHEAVVAAGLVVDAAPADTPWSRREFAFRLPDGHTVTVSGASSG
ncbi:GNAT family N-acetyltransferase [Streptomyces sp. SID13031]|uniref:GNAT family N-acetyltransferase n=1 Tax=Streptomyces sp. SID13031 TaxID=2706046 RepID=UPI0013C7171B|nr:GNAT family N-acetyltransferase [Streptomyces sp. SID13031]NEA35416.1 GNAT family N-acetyltransferase [Streptomyces sp. SID13031]